MFTAILICVLVLMTATLWSNTRRLERLEQDAVTDSKDLDALAGVVAKNADRTTRLEGEDAPRRPVCSETYMATRYPKRADEL